ncbi:Hsp70 family protein [Herbiconiux daphne]|uniref:Uncharacterized protein n=1 Tax=Herbiconiux daphne TaxID=2970914 RepID=A0ABT2H4T1_9MICO|nr:hypothetical protein [Herbiconiux daphne]MCS5734950.1 hypothetical protein [Herbiconiux daphne]
MSYVIAIDLGEGIAAAAVIDLVDGSSHRNGDVRSVALSRTEPADGTVWIGDDGYAYFGDEAAERSLAQPERALRGVLDRVGEPEPEAEPGTTPEIRPEEVVAAQVAWIVDVAIEQEGHEPEAVALVHPDTWGSREIELMTAALAVEGLDDVELYSEQEAFAASEAWEGTPEHGAGLLLASLFVMSPAVEPVAAVTAVAPIGRDESLAPGSAAAGKAASIAAPASAVGVVGAQWNRMIHGSRRRLVLASAVAAAVVLATTAGAVGLGGLIQTRDPASATSAKASVGDSASGSGSASSGDADAASRAKSPTIEKTGDTTEAPVVGTPAPTNGSQTPPTAPVAPRSPSNPSSPSRPVAPTNPANPPAPSRPATPANPTTPSRPTTPTSPTRPTTPSTPSPTPTPTPTPTQPPVVTPTPDPVPVDPAPVDPAPVDPAPVDPAPVDPAPVDPAPVDPAPVDPAPVDPAPVDPAPVDPAPVDPAPVDPVP